MSRSSPEIVTKFVKSVRQVRETVRRIYGKCKFLASRREDVIDGDDGDERDELMFVVR